MSSVFQFRLRNVNVLSLQYRDEDDASRRAMKDVFFAMQKAGTNILWTVHDGDVKVIMPDRSERILTRDQLSLFPAHVLIGMLGDSE